eukprot:835742-Rhodomonas_salina.1
MAREHHAGTGSSLSTCTATTGVVQDLNRQEFVSSGWRSFPAQATFLHLRTLETRKLECSSSESSAETVQTLTRARVLAFKGSPLSLPETTVTKYVPGYTRVDLPGYLGTQLEHLCSKLHTPGLPVVPSTDSAIGITQYEKEVVLTS